MTATKAAALDVVMDEPASTRRAEVIVQMRQHGNFDVALSCRQSPFPIRTTLTGLAAHLDRHPGHVRDDVRPVTP